MSDSADPYLDPHTGILRNLVGATTWEELSAAERALSHAQLLLLSKSPVNPTRDLAELRAIHKVLFGDVYPWAGEFRTVDLRKATPGAKPFAPAALLDRATWFCEQELRDDNWLRGLDRQRFVHRLAHHYDQLNDVHPFREGNGRTQRLFWTGIAADAGWQLDWSRVTGEVNDRASRIAREHGDLQELRKMLDAITAAAPTGRRPAADPTAVQIARLSFAGSAPSLEKSTGTAATRPGPTPSARTTRDRRGRNR